jgi:hypothetical protein
MIETAIEILSHQATWAILGIIASAFCPAAVPILGASRKLVKELTILHETNGHKNSQIVESAVELGLGSAQKFLTKQLTDDT